MGMFSRIGSLLRGTRKSQIALDGAGAIALETAALDDAGPVAIDITDTHDYDDEPAAFHAPAGGSNGIANADADRAPRSKQELLAELQKNYQEVLHLVRKVDGHLDDQSKRSARLLQLAEQMPASVQSLTAIREQNAEMIERLDQLAADNRNGAVRADEARERQLSALSEVRDAMVSAQATESRVAESLDDFRSSLTAVAGSTDKLNAALDTMREREDERDAKLAEVITSGQKWVVTAVILGLVCLGAVVVMGVVAAGG